MNQVDLVSSFHQGQCLDAYHFFGVHPDEKGYVFRVYAPHAGNVCLIGDFTGWYDNPIPMERTEFTGIWQVHVDNAKQWDCYKYHILTDKGWIDKADPYAFYAETRPGTASKIVDLSLIRYTDQKWMEKRSRNSDKPMNIYEVYAGGWKHAGEFPYSYAELEKELIPYVKKMGFTHIEMMPLNEYPFDGSWGYQASGYYAVTSRYGNPYEYASFVNACHKAGIGVIMDMVPVHFVKDTFGLAYFDGSPLYEYAKDEDAQSQWGTLNFNLWSEEVRSFLISAAAFWCDVYHMDGIRMDAVSNLIYWGGNSSRGTNEGALYFIKRLNYLLHQKFPSLMMIAEDSSDYPKVTWDTEEGGLGFDYKWDLGWMNDTLKYYATDPLFRIWDHHKITFSMHYFNSERFLLPLSHDENVHGKKTIVDRMWGSYEEKFAQVRNLYAYMYAHPGKKLNFMGNEIASFREFDEKKELDWFLLDYPMHDAFHKFFAKLNEIYGDHPCLWEKDYDPAGFRWIDADNAKQSVFSFYRQNKDEVIVVVLNCTGAEYPVFGVGVPYKGEYEELLNTDSVCFGGKDRINYGKLSAVKGEWDQYLPIRLAPWSAVYLIHRKKGES